MKSLETFKLYRSDEPSHPIHCHQFTFRIAALVYKKAHARANAARKTKPAYPLNTQARSRLKDRRLKSTLSPLRVGWREWLSLPDLNLSWIKVKVDTGARTSALHAGDIHFFDREGTDWVRFRVRPAVGSHETHDLCEARIIDFREVTDSGGKTERRAVIRSTVHNGHYRAPIDITLTDRSTMRFSMLLGRTALPKDAMVLPRRSFLLGGDRYQPPETP